MASSPPNASPGPDPFPHHQKNKNSETTNENRQPHDADREVAEESDENEVEVEVRRDTPSSQQLQVASSTSTLLHESTVERSSSSLKWSTSNNHSDDFPVVPLILQPAPFASHHHQHSSSHDSSSQRASSSTFFLTSLPSSPLPVPLSHTGYREGSLHGRKPSHPQSSQTQGMGLNPRPVMSPHIPLQSEHSHSSLSDKSQSQVFSRRGSFEGSIVNAELGRRSSFEALHGPHSPSRLTPPRLPPPMIPPNRPASTLDPNMDINQKIAQSDVNIRVRVAIFLLKVLFHLSAEHGSGGLYFTIWKKTLNDEVFKSDYSHARLVAITGESSNMKGRAGKGKRAGVNKKEGGSRAQIKGDVTQSIRPSMQFAVYSNRNGDIGWRDDIVNHIDTTSGIHSFLEAAYAGTRPEGFKPCPSCPTFDERYKGSLVNKNRLEQYFLAIGKCTVCQVGQGSFTPTGNGMEHLYACSSDGEPLTDSRNRRINAGILLSDIFNGDIPSSNDDKWWQCMGVALGLSGHTLNSTPLLEDCYGFAMNFAHDDEPDDSQIMGNSASYLSTRNELPSLKGSSLKTKGSSSMTSSSTRLDNLSPVHVSPTTRHSLENPEVVDGLTLLAESIPHRDISNPSLHSLSRSPSLHLSSSLPKDDERPRPFVEKLEATALAKRKRDASFLPSDDKDQLDPSRLRRKQSKLSISENPFDSFQSSSSSSSLSRHVNQASSNQFSPSIPPSNKPSSQQATKPVTVRPTEAPLSSNLASVPTFLPAPLVLPSPLPGFSLPFGQVPIASLPTNPSEVPRPLPSANHFFVNTPTVPDRMQTPFFEHFPHAVYVPRAYFDPYPSLQPYMYAPSLLMPAGPGGALGPTPPPFAPLYVQGYNLPVSSTPHNFDFAQTSRQAPFLQFPPPLTVAIDLPALIPAQSIKAERMSPTPMPNFGSSSTPRLVAAPKATAPSKLPPSTSASFP